MIAWKPTLTIIAVLGIAAGTIVLAAWQPSDAAHVAKPPHVVAESTASTAAAYNQQPLPDNAFGKVAALGKRIFDDPARYAPQYVGNSLTCSNCHLQSGTQAGSAPLWAAWMAYPAYRAKNGHVNSFEERLQGCFRFSMNGKAPPLGSPELVALESYAWWLAKGQRLDAHARGRGFSKLPAPPLPADYARGQQVYGQRCALCHAQDGSGQSDNKGHAAFPALWGAASFNWGAGMGSISHAAAFIRGNMPYSQGNTLTLQQAWDVALYMNSQDRPQDPRFTGSVAETRQKFHHSASSMYGRQVNGSVLGSLSPPAGGRLNDKDQP